MKQWITPTMQYYSLYADMLKQTHLLIAGATGSGKSVVINGIVTTSLQYSPEQVQYILIDPKRVELIDYKLLPHTIVYASEPDSMIQALQRTTNIIEGRYTVMQRQHVKKYQGSNVYIVIDELADLMTTNKKQVQPLIQRIAQIGRAANVHIIAATQCPLSAVIPTPIKVNFDSRVGLRTRSKQDSRNILGCGGCELLPSYGQGYYMTAQGIELYKIPMYDQTTTNALIKHWTRQNRPLSLFHRH